MIDTARERSLRILVCNFITDNSLITKYAQYRTSNQIKNRRHIFVFTGAGVSAESGIPTFRDAQTGLWTNSNVTHLASPAGYRTDKELVWGWYEWRRMKVLQAKPNPAHIAIAAPQAAQFHTLTK